MKGVGPRGEKMLGDLLHGVEGWSVQKTPNTVTMICLSCLQSKLFPTRAACTAEEEASIRGRNQKWLHNPAFSGVPNKGMYQKWPHNPAFSGVPNKEMESKVAT